MTRHVFLTGAKQVGKSTLLKKTLRSFEGQIGGFFTLRTCEYLKTGFSVHLFPAAAPADPDETNLLFVCGASAALSSNETPRRFDRLGCNALSDFLQKDLILMDELGPHEAEAILFRQMVFKVLDGPVPVLGVLQEARSPFLQEIAQRPDVTLLRITEENRNDSELLNQLTSLLPTVPCPSSVLPAHLQGFPIS